MRILFYIPFVSRSRDTESVMMAFKKKGHDVLSLNQMKDSEIHDYLKTQGIETFDHSVESKNPLLFYLSHISYFIWFCWRYKIQIVYCHLEPASFVAVMAQYFVRAKIYVCRHHEDLFALTKRDQYLSYKLTYRLAKKIIVVSESTKCYLINYEQVPAEKVKAINLGYDFSLYPMPSQKEIKRIKSEMTADIVLITIGQLVPLKRPEVSVRILHKLVKKGFNAKLILLGRGAEQSKLTDLIEALGLSGRVIMPGHVKNVMGYIASSTFLVHPSVSESSCVVVKEAALVNTPVIVSRGVGDFDFYIENKINGFVVDKDNFVDESVALIEGYFRSPEVLGQVGSNLNNKVRELFSIDNVVQKYQPLNTF